VITFFFEEIFVITLASKYTNQAGADTVPLSILNPAKKRRSLLLLVTSMFTTSAGLFLFAANSCDA